MSAELVAIEGGHNQLNSEQVDLLKRTIAKGTSDDEFALFIQTCNRTGLDPFHRQIFAVSRRDYNENRDVMTIQVAIDGLRLIADRSGKYAGQKPAEWCGDDGVWRDVWLDKEPPRAARVSVLRHDFIEPVTAVALWDGYVQTYKKNSQTHINTMWTKQGPLMLAKCAEALALRKAFPADMSGLYTNDEYQAGNEIPAVLPANEETRAFLQDAIDHLDDSQKNQLKAEWRDMGIAPLGRLPENRITDVVELIRSINPSVLLVDPITGEVLPDPDEEITDAELVPDEVPDGPDEVDFTDCTCEVHAGEDGEPSRFPNPECPVHEPF